MPPALDGRRQHGAVQHGDRCALERAGWRTTLEYRENHLRGRDGRLRQLRVEWRAEAERDVGRAEPIVIWACGSTVEKAWSRLRLQADVVESRDLRRDAGPRRGRDRHAVGRSAVTAAPAAEPLATA